MTIRSIADALAFALAFSFIMYHAGQVSSQHSAKPEHAIERRSPPEEKPIFGWRLRASQEGLLPPEQYRHYDGKYEIHRASIPWITARCRDALQRGTLKANRAMGCAEKYATRCVIYIATDEDLEKIGFDYEIILAHELGHCAGWVHTY